MSKLHRAIRSIRTLRYWVVLLFGYGMVFSFRYGMVSSLVWYFHLCMVISFGCDAFIWVWSSLAAPLFSVACLDDVLAEPLPTDFSADMLLPMYCNTHQW